MRRGSAKSAEELQAFREKIVELEADALNFFSPTARKISVPEKIGNYSLASVIGTESDALKSRPLSKNLVFIDDGVLNSITTNKIVNFEDIRPTEHFIQPYPNPAPGRLSSVARHLKIGRQTVGLAG
jgi:hypothetical protein